MRERERIEKGKYFELRVSRVEEISRMNEVRSENRKRERDIENTYTS